MWQAPHKKEQRSPGAKRPADTRRFRLDGALGEKNVYNPYDILLYSYFAGPGLDVTVEDSNSRGRPDMAMRFNGNVYLFEFKVVELAPKGAAMAQLKRRRYADKYRDLGEPIRLVAVEFSREERNLARSRWSALDARERAIEFDAAHLLFRRAHRSPGISASTGLSRPFTGSMPRPKISKVTVPSNGCAPSSRNTTGESSCWPSSRIQVLPKPRSTRPPPASTNLLVP